MGRKVFYFYFILIHSSSSSNHHRELLYPETSARIKTALCPVNCTACGRSSGASKLLKHSSLCTRIYIYIYLHDPEMRAGYLPPHSSPRRTLLLLELIRRYIRERVYTYIYIFVHADRFYTPNYCPPPLHPAPFGPRGTLKVGVKLYSKHKQYIHLYIIYI